MRKDDQDLLFAGEKIVNSHFGVVMGRDYKMTDAVDGNGI